jgi:hypothetical protein
MHLGSLRGSCIEFQLIQDKSWMSLGHSFVQLSFTFFHRVWNPLEHQPIHSMDLQTNKTMQTNGPRSVDP